MARFSAILWCDCSISFWVGCTGVSPGCANCFAEFQEDTRFHRARWGNHPRVRTSAATWREPRKWDREAAALGWHLIVFANVVSDFFDNQVPEEWRREAWEIIRRTQHLIWVILTK